MEMKNELARICIRGDLNMMFTISKSIVNILDLTESVPLANETLRNLSDTLLCLAADVSGRILRDYGEDGSDKST